MAKAAPTEEERNTPDALPGVPLPRESRTLFGHAAAEQALLDAYRSGRIHHGWILAGARGIGRATLAFRFARFLFVHPDPAAPEVAAAEDLSVPDDHPAVHRVAAGAHANLLHLQREWDDRARRFRTEISVESARRIVRFLGSTAGEGGWRVVIVDPADDMSGSAANSILKSLEEPPRQTVFLLVTRSRGALLPTILSRTRTLHLAPLSREETEMVVRRVAPDPGGRGGSSLAAALAGGSPRRLIEIRQKRGEDLYNLILGAIEQQSPEAQFSLAGKITDAATAEQFLELFKGYLGRRVRGLPEPSQDARPPSLPLVTWAELWEKATLSGREVETYNLDRRQFVLDLLETSSAVLRQSGTADA